MSDRVTLKSWMPLALLLCTRAPGAEYTGPRPPKPDLPYLLHADRLIETELAQAHQESRKNEIAYTIDGANSPARTPLSEPIFVLDAHKFSADRIELYRLESRNGHREAILSGGGGRKKHTGSSGRPIHMLVTPLGGSLYKIEADEHLDEGEYTLAPNDSSVVFCFSVY